MREKIKLKKEESGITLIALIITIIVLLILAGISIATLTGENGLLNKATEAKEKSAEKAAEEKVAIEVLGSYETDGKINLDLLNNNLKNNIKGLKYNNQEISDSNKITSLPATVVVDGYEVEIAENGTVIAKESSGEMIETPSREPANGTTTNYFSAQQYLYDSDGERYEYDEEEEEYSFRYILTPIENGNAMPEGSTNGSYVFDMYGRDEIEICITFDYIGVSTYSLKQVIDEELTGWSYDEEEYIITVNTKYDNKGNLISETALNRVSDGFFSRNAKFTNTYKNN